MAEGGADDRVAVRARRDPRGRELPFEISIRQPVGAGLRHRALHEHQVVQVNIPGCAQEDEEIGPRRTGRTWNHTAVNTATPAAVGGAGKVGGGPVNRRNVARGPVERPAVVLPHIDELDGRRRRDAVGPHRPRQHAFVTHLVDHDILRRRRAGFDQRDRLPARLQIPTKLTEDRDRRAVGGDERATVLYQHEVLAIGDDGAFGEDVIQPIETPARQVVGKARLVVDLHELRVRRQRVEHDLVDHQRRLRRRNLRGRIHGDVRRESCQRVALEIESLQVQNGVSRNDGDKDGEVFSTRPSDGILDAIHEDCLGFDRRLADQRDVIVSRVDGAAAGEQEVRRIFRLDRIENR